MLGLFRSSFLFLLLNKLLRINIESSPLLGSSTAMRTWPKFPEAGNYGDYSAMDITKVSFFIDVVYTCISSFAFYFMKFLPY
jgi:hypothetical protein